MRDTPSMRDMPSTLASEGIRILDLDQSLTGQRELLQHNSHIVDLRQLAPRLRFLSTRAAMRDFQLALQPSEKHRLTFYGSGDFHHLSAELIRQWSTPLSVVVFDNHPDWDISSPLPCCGSWVNEILSFPFIQKVIVIGLGRFDLRGWNLLRGNTAALRSGKLELYPATWRRSKMLFAPDVRWKTLAREGWERVTNRVIERLPTEDIYISVDKDCLRKQSAISNWEEGETLLPPLLYAIERLRNEKRIVGADVTGEYSRGENASLLFQAISRLNHPPQPPFSLRGMEANQRTNLALLQAFQAATW